MSKTLFVLGATTVALCAGAAWAGTTSPRDVYTDGAMGVRTPDPYSDGAKTSKFDVYTDGARISDRRDAFSDGARTIDKRDTFTDGA